MKIHLDRDKCTGLGICEGFAPDVFEVDDEGDLVVLNDVVDETDESLESAVVKAIEGCPTHALRLER